MKLEEAKDVYDAIKVPEELDQMVRKSVMEHPFQDEIIKKDAKYKAVTWIKYTASAAAVILLCFIAALNSNEVFAKAAGDIPVLGHIARVLTVRSYTKVEENENITVEIPAIDTTGESLSQTAQADNQPNEGNTADQNNKFVVDVNTEIERVVDDYLADAQERKEADKQAFLATGGTEEEWAQRDLNINVDYEVKYQKDNTLSLVLTADESWYGAYDLTYYYNLDLENNRELTLSDVLGNNYSEVADSSIVSQMKERAGQNNNYVYWGITDNNESGITGFTTVNEKTKFYINDKGNVVICFDKYEVAPGFMGKQEFVIALID